MEPEQLSKITDLLFGIRHQLLATIDDNGGATETVELDQAMVGRLSRMDAMQHQEMAKATKRRAKVRLQRVELCLQRIADDHEHFGYCDDCFEPIPYARLCELPDSECCVPCLEERANS